MNWHGLADAKRHWLRRMQSISREGGNLEIYSKIYSEFSSELAPHESVAANVVRLWFTFYRLGGMWFFWTADYADYADFTRIKFQGCYMRGGTNIIFYFLIHKMQTESVRIFRRIFCKDFEQSDPKYRNAFAYF